MNVPTVEDFFRRYATFRDIDAEQVGFAIEDASRAVGTPTETRWPESDYAPAIMLLTAHFLTNARIEKAMQDAGGSHIASEKVGDVEIRYNTAKINAAGSGSLYGSTEYGKRFESLQRSLFVGPILL